MYLKTYKILLLEDNSDDVVMIERVLKRENFLFETKCVDSRSEFLRGVKEFRPDVILSDHSLPQFNSMEALRICREVELNIPFILVTGTVSEEFAVECLRKGADDYILKSNMARLPSAIQNAISKKEAEIFRKNAEKTLQKKNRELVKINRELDSFVYSISHNLRSPLTSVLGLLHIAKLEFQDENCKCGLESFLDKMENSIKKLDDTLREIIDYSKNAHIDSEIREINLRDLIEENMEKLRYLKGFDKVEKEIVIHQAVPFYSDCFRVSVIVDNLISNAIKYLDEAKEKSFIRVSSTIDKKCITMEFKDNGIGISSDCLPKIYNMFFRATEVNEGSGLGLYIVKESLEKLKGKIEVSSQQKTGTCFTLTIPNLYSRYSKKTETLEKTSQY